MDPIGGDIYSVSIKEEITDETEATHELIDVKQEDEMFVPDEADGFIHVKQEDDMLVPSRDALMNDDEDEGLSSSIEEGEPVHLDKRKRLDKSDSPCENLCMNIRDNFGRYVKKRKTEIGQAVANSKNSKFEVKMPYSYDRDPLTNVLLAETSLLKEQRHAIKGLGESKNTTLCASALLMKHSFDKNGTHLPRHHIDSFLAGIGSTMKKLNRYNQHVAKGRIFNLVQNLVSQELFNQSSYT
ncbi:unnamed protein product [Nezara viridula]|uniref:Uncharacterized protein n=1 Tax=Nezara viridula TaxID=85310 RepID=A0A9P0EER8_NEZVI|nr:unnamed protein product [Nezara viridula]